jgi:hypothetical protein
MLPYKLALLIRLPQGKAEWEVAAVMGGDVAAAAPCATFSPTTHRTRGRDRTSGSIMINSEVSFIFAAACMIGTAAMLFAMITMPL